MDFDFFGSQPLDETRLVPAIPFLADAVVTQRAPNTFSCTIDRGGVVRLSFFGLPHLPRLLPPLVAADNGLRVEVRLVDLAAAKARVVRVRAEAKDYIDIDALLSDGRIDLPRALAAAVMIYGSAFNPQNTLKALSYFEDGNLRRLPGPLRARLATAAREVDLDRLPVIDAPEDGS